MYESGQLVELKDGQRVGACNFWKQKGLRARTPIETRQSNTERKGEGIVNVLEV